MIVSKRTGEPRRSGINKAHLELYKMLYSNNKDGTQFTKEDLLEVYGKYVVPDKAHYDNHSQARTKEQIYANASSWLNGSISKLVRRGYLGLTFKKDLKCLTEQ